MKKLITITAIIISSVMFNPAFSLSLKMAIKEGLKNNPDLKASLWKTRSLLDKEEAAGGGASTMLRTGLMNIPTDTFSLNQDMMNQVVFGIKQKIFFPGKLSLKKDIARELRRISEWDHEAKKRRIKALIKEGYFRILYLNKVIKLSRETQNLLNQFQSIARTRYAVGKGLLQDMAKANFEASRLKEKIINLENKRKTAVIFFNRLLGRSAAAHVKNLSGFSGKFRLISMAKIHNHILVKSTSLKMAEYNLNRTKWKKKLASRMLWPDFALGSSYGIRTKSNSANLLSFNFEISIPIFTSRGKKVDALKKMVKKQTHTLEAVRQNVLKTAASIFTDLLTRKKLLTLYDKELIPLAKLSVRSALSAYQVGKLEFISLIMAQLLLYRYQVNDENNLRLYRTHFAHLEFLTGKNFIKGVK